MSIYQDEITLIADFNTIINNESLCEKFTGEVVIKISPNGVDEGWYANSNKGAKRAWHIADLMTIASDENYQAKSYAENLALKEQGRFKFDDSILRMFERFSDFTKYRFEVRRVNNAKAMKEEYIRHQDCWYLNKKDQSTVSATEEDTERQYMYEA